MIYLGDFPASHTAVCIPWGSFAAATGAPSATTGFAAADVKIYKDFGTTERASANGITVVADFDTRTGLNAITIDLSDNSDASFYATGHEYQVAVDAVTIDSQTVRFWAGSFSIERASGALALTKSATFGLSALKTLIDAIGTKTTNLPSDPADQSDIIAATTAIFSRVGAPAGSSLAGDLATLQTTANAVKTKTDSLAFTVAGELDANMVSLSGSADAADRLKSGANTNAIFTVGTGSTTTSIVTSECDPPPVSGNHYQGAILKFDIATTTAALRGQAVKVTGSTASATPVLTVNTLTDAPQADDFGVIL